MKKGLLLLTALLCLASVAQAKGANDPVLMTVAGKPVTLSEFEYLYHKNNAQQSTPQAIEEYLQLVVPYRQKVAAAEAAGIDTTASFNKEFQNYRNELSAPYLVDKAVEDSILHGQYDRMKQEVQVSHIMLFFGDKSMTREREKELMDSLHTCLVNGEKMADLAAKYSQDRGSKGRGGSMGYIQANRFPKSFEDRAWTLPVGAVSDVFTTPFGFHIMQVTDRRPARGEVHAAHILRLTRGMQEAEAQAQKQYIDSIYTLLKNGADFAQVAKTNSQDTQSAVNGGDLNWFGTGMMVPEFENVAFSLQNGEVSEPFQSQFGWHIIKKLDSRGVPEFDKVKGDIEKYIAHDSIGRLPAERCLARLSKQYKAKIEQKNLDKILSGIKLAGGVDSTMLANFRTNNTVVAKLGKQKITLAEVMASQLVNGFAGTADQQAQQLNVAVKQTLDDAVVEHRRATLMDEEPAYRNLVNEYRDGMLMFEIQDRNVWSKAKNDSEGLEKYFEANRDKYKWDVPHLKSRIIFATNDSILTEVKKYLCANKVSGDSLQMVLSKQFGKDVKVERVLAGKGENAITDYLAFGGEKPEKIARWAAYMTFEPKIIDAPEDAGDVRGVVISDYQDHLLEEWVKTLGELYPAKIDRKVLSKAK